MPEYAEREQTQVSSSTKVVASDVEIDDSNSAIAEEVPGVSDAGLANYQAALGTWLGGELYDAVSPHLTLESLSGVATDGLNSVLKALGEQLNNLGDADEGAVEAFAEALANKYDDLAGEWVEANPGIQQALAGWVDAHPRTIAAVGLLAAAGAVLANVELPELKKKLDLGAGFTASGGVKLGRIRDIALEQIKAKLEYASGPLIAAVQVEHGESTSGTISAGFGSDTQRVDGSVKVTETGIDAWGLRGLYGLDGGITLSGGVSGTGSDAPTVNAQIKRVDGSLTTINGVDYDASTGRISTDMSAEWKKDGLTLGGSGELDQKGIAEASAWAKYESEDRTLAGSGTYSRDGTSSLDLRWDESWSEDWQTRLRQRNEWSALGNSSETTALGAYNAGDGIKFFGGTSYLNDQDGGRLVPQVGMQIDDVPISIRYDTGSSTISVGIEIPF